MKMDEITGKLFLIIKKIDDIKSLEPDLIIKVDSESLKSINYIISSYHHMLETEYLKDRWIRDDVLRFLAFYHRESQISKLQEKNRKIKSPVYIVVIDKTKVDLESLKVDEMNLEDNLDEIDELAIFRIEIEKERR